MSQTSNLNLKKHDNVSTNENAFDIENYLNANWDKIDQFAGNIDDEIDDIQTTKVDKISGKGLSTNDFTNEYKNKLDNTTASYTTEKDTKLNGIESQANKTIVDTELDNESTNPVQNKVIADKIQELEEENASLQQENINLRKSGYKISGTGETVTLNKTAEVGFVEPPLPKGNSKQNTYEGYQLLDFSSATIPSGVTAIYYDNGDVLLQNTTSATKYVSCLADSNLIESGNSYTLKAEFGTSQTCNIWLQKSNSDYSKVIAISGNVTNTATDTYMNTLIGIDANKTIKVRLTLVEGTAAKDFEPYVGGQPSPNPFYEQEIQVVKGDAEVRVQNKNWFNKNTVIRNELIGGNGSLTDFEGVFTSDFIKVKPNTDYHVNKYIPVIVGFDKNKNSLGYIRNGIGEYSFTTASDCEFVRVRSFDVTTDMEEGIEKAQLELGLTASSYTPHQEQKLPLYLPVENLWSLDNSYSSTTRNQWVLLDTNYHLDAGTYTISFDATVDKKVQFNFKDANNTSLTVNIETNATFTTSVPLKKVAINIVSANNTISNIQIELGSKANHYTPFGTTPIELCKIVDYKDKFEKNNGDWKIPNKILKINSYNGETITTPYISSTGGLDIGATVYYVGDNDLEITDTTLISQLEAIANSTSYYEQTNIFSTDETSPIFDVTAIADMNLLIDSIDARLTLVEG